MYEDKTQEEKYVKIPKEAKNKISRNPALPFHDRKMSFPAKEKNTPWGRKISRLMSRIKDGDAAEMCRLMADPDVYTHKYVQTIVFAYVCQEGNADMIEALMKCNAPINYNTEHACGIHFVVKNNNLRALRLLMDDPRIDVNTLSKDGNTVLHIAAASARALDMVKIILASGRFTSAEAKNHKDQDTMSFGFPFVPDKVVALIKEYISDPANTREKLQIELGYPQYQAGELFAMVVLLCDEYLEIKV